MDLVVLESGEDGSILIPLCLIGRPGLAAENRVCFFESRIRLPQSLRTPRRPSAPPSRSSRISRHEARLPLPDAAGPLQGPPFDAERNLSSSHRAHDCVQLEQGRSLARTPKSCVAPA